MSSFNLILILLNTIWLGYLTFIVYQKNRKKNSPSLSLDETLLSKSISKIKLVRYNPFDDVGSNQSFILVMLDNTNSGVVLTTLHNRGFTRVYAKTIKNGQADGIALSKEEKSAIIESISH